MLIRHAQIPNLLFKWVQLDSREYYNRTLGQCHTVSVLDQPRTIFLKSLLSKSRAEAVNDLVAATHLYTPTGWHHDRQTATVYAEQMMSKYNYIKEHGVDPVQLLEGLSNPARLIVEDGHHRLIIAHSMGIDVEATTIPATRGLVAEWNTHKRNNDGMHLYQSVFVNRQSIVSGQRDDALARMDSVHPSDLKGKSVLVLGCNNGHDCFMAGERGATRILGVDFDKLLLNYALRVATCYGYPTDFIHHDLRNPLDVGRFDTVLCFSVYDSVGSALLMPTLLNAGGVVYFEGHMLNKPILSDQEYRAHYQDILCHFGTVSLTYETACKSRRIYRLENL